MDTRINLVLGIIQIVVQFAAAYFSYRIYKYNRLNQAWLAVTWALVFMTLRRITALMIELKYISSFSGWIADLDRIILPFIISILLFWGFLAMLKNFENFEVVEKKVRKKINLFKKNK